MRETLMIRAFVKLLLALSLVVGLVVTAGAASPASAAAAADCSRTKARVGATIDRLATVKGQYPAAVDRFVERRAVVVTLQRKVRKHSTPAKVRRLKAARRDLNVAKTRVVVLRKEAAKARDAITTAKVAHGLCTAGPDASEGELFDLLEALGLAPLLDMIGLPALLKSLGVVDLLEMLGLADILEDLGLGSLIGR